MQRNVAKCNAVECMFMQIMNKCDIIWILPAALWRLREAVCQPTGRAQRANEIRVGIKNAAEGSCPVLYMMTRLTFIHRWKELLTPLTVISIHTPPSNLICYQNCNRMTRHQWQGGLSMVQTSVINVKAMNSWRLGVREGWGEPEQLCSMNQRRREREGSKGVWNSYLWYFAICGARWDETEDTCSCRLSASF